MEIFTELTRLWDAWMEFSDPRVAEWPLMNSIIPTIVLVISYVFLIRCVSPVLLLSLFSLLVLKAFMKNREPVGKALKPVLIVYNLFLVLLSAWMAISIFYHAIVGLKFQFYCNNVVPYGTSEVCEMKN
jgi:hypothetical protein